MIVRTLIAAVIAAPVFALAANAVTIVNSDRVPHHVAYVPTGGKAIKLTLKARQSKKLDCNAGGALTLGQATVACNVKSDKITIKNGKFSG
jgi:hypothetical protein